MDPHACPRAVPALWSPACAPGVTVIETSDPEDSLVPQGWRALCHLCNRQDRHLVLGCGAERLRLCVRHVPGREAPFIVLCQDDLLAVRLRAATRYARAAARNARISTGAVPTRYQRAHLARLLAIADATALGASARDIAFTIVFPRHVPFTGSAWKGSGERRHTLRLIGQARQLTDGGHLRLLRHG